jgi:hypothetical protein
MVTIYDAICQLRGSLRGLGTADAPVHASLCLKCADAVHLRAVSNRIEFAVLSFFPAPVGCPPTAVGYAPIGGIALSVPHQSPGSVCREFLLPCPIPFPMSHLSAGTVIIGGDSVTCAITGGQQSSPTGAPACSPFKPRVVAPRRPPLETVHVCIVFRRLPSDWARCFW